MVSDLKKKGGGGGARAGWTGRWGKPAFARMEKGAAAGWVTQPGLPKGPQPCSGKQRKGEERGGDGGWGEQTGRGAEGQKLGAELGGKKTGGGGDRDKTSKKKKTVIKKGVGTPGSKRDLCFLTKANCQALIITGTPLPLLEKKKGHAELGDQLAQNVVEKCQVTS